MAAFYFWSSAANVNFSPTVVVPFPISTFRALSLVVSIAISLPTFIISIIPWFPIYFGPSVAVSVSHTMVLTIAPSIAIHSPLPPLSPSLPITLVPIVVINISPLLTASSTPVVVVNFPPSIYTDAVRNLLKRTIASSGPPSMGALLIPAITAHFWPNKALALSCAYAITFSMPPMAAWTVVGCLLGLSGLWVDVSVGRRIRGGFLGP